MCVCERDRDEGKGTEKKWMETIKTMKRNIKIFDGIEGTMWYCWNGRNARCGLISWWNGKWLKCNMNEAYLMSAFTWMVMLWTCEGCQQFEIFFSVFLYSPHVISVNGNENNYMVFLFTVRFSIPFDHCVICGCIGKLLKFQWKICLFFFYMRPRLLLNWQ